MMKKSKIIIAVILFVVGIVLFCTKHGFFASMVIGIAIFLLIPKEYLENKKKQQKREPPHHRRRYTLLNWWWLNNH